ncbi:hypothetical protein LEN26_015887 [Aphanomyces euteiches]|nr:hypothetical protein LEN26_015887 [Aphanomyces euteiches]
MRRLVGSIRQRPDGCQSSPSTRSINGQMTVKQIQRLDELDVGQYLGSTRLDRSLASPDMSGRGEEFGPSDSFLKLKRKQQAMSKKPAAGKSVPQDPMKETLKAVRASIATADQIRQLLTECVSKSTDLAEEQKLIQDQLKAESAARAIPAADPVSEFVDYISGKIKGQDAWIEILRAQATIFRLEKGGGLLPPIIPKTSSTEGSTVLNLADSDDEFDPDSTGEPESKKEIEPPTANVITIDAEGVAALRHFPNLDGGFRLKYIEVRDAKPWDRWIANFQSFLPGINTAQLEWNQMLRQW